MNVLASIYSQNNQDLYDSVAKGPAQQARLGIKQVRLDKN